MLGTKGKKKQQATQASVSGRGSASSAPALEERSLSQFNSVGRKRSSSSLR